MSLASVATGASRALAIRCRSRLALAGLVTLLVGGCSKENAPVERTEPWPAPQVQLPAQSAVVRYSVAPNSEVRVSLRAREAHLSGVMSVVSGKLEVDLLDLSRTRGTIRVDVASLRMHVAEKTSESRRQTSEAMNWLDLGSSKPEAQRERNRWAQFVISGIERVSAKTAHEGRRVKLAPPPPPSDEGADASRSDEAGSASLKSKEIREVSFSAHGELTLHGYRVEHTARLRARFHYPTAATPGAKPSRLLIETRAPFLVSLAAHGIKPRDAAGVFVASGVKLWGVKVAREARISARLTAFPSP